MTSGSVRLRGATLSAGRVEVFYDGQWGTVCNDAWDINDANVVCRQLGFSQLASQARGSAYYGQGSGPIWIDDVACSGNESHIYDCRHRGWGTMTVHTAEMPVCSVLMLMVLLTFVWWMAVLIMAELKFITTANGAQSVMISGISMKLMWFAVSLVSPVRTRHHQARDMAKDLALSG